MLQVIGFQDVANTSVVVDAYIPISFRCADTRSIPVLYWMSGDLQRTVIEVGVNNTTGAICKITLVLARLASGCSITKDAPEPSVSGVPMCKLDPWIVNNVIDDPYDFTTELSNDELLVWLGPDRAVITISKAGSAEFGVNAESQLLLMRFTDLTPKDIERIKRRTRQPGIDAG